jgi:hypothetical protein
MDPLTPLEYQIALLRSEYRDMTSSLPITTQAAIVLGAGRYCNGYPNPLLYPSSSLLYPPLFWGGGGYGLSGHRWGRGHYRW